MPKGRLLGRRSAHGWFARPTCSNSRPQLPRYWYQYYRLTDYCRRIEWDSASLAARLSKPKSPTQLESRTTPLRLNADTRIGKEEAMSGTGLAAVLLMVGAVMLVMCYWKQIAIFLLFVAVTVFCLGVYYIVSMIGLYM